jgi:hypothetical protein
MEPTVLRSGRSNSSKETPSAFRSSTSASISVTLVQYGDYECPNSGEEVAPEVRDAVARHRAP